MNSHAIMMRALELARRGEINAHPNPMVGAVLTDRNGLIAGEGWHMKFGEAHAEVNAIADCERRGINPADCTIHVTLEPCAHYGKTPPCASLIIDKGIRRAVIGCIDPFAKVAGRGIAMMREAGIDVTIADGETERLCRELNRRFFTAHTLKRPYVAVKWAESSDGYLDTLRDDPSVPPAKISTPCSRMAMHRYRSTFDAIAVGSNTERLDRPALDARLWPRGRAPQRVYFTREAPLGGQLHLLYRDKGITSLLVEGGPTLIRSFVTEGIIDEIRREQSPMPLGQNGIKIL